MARDVVEVPPMGGQTEDVSAIDREAIVAVAVEYIESWLGGDGGRMGRCLHPALAKRMAVDPRRGTLDLHEVPYVELIASAGSGPKEVDRAYDVTVLDCFSSIATVKVASAPFMDYLHLARFGDRWLIVNVLYEPR